MWLKYGLKAQKLLAQGTPWVITDTKLVALLSSSKGCDINP